MIAVMGAHTMTVDLTPSLSAAPGRKRIIHCSIQAEIYAALKRKPRPACSCFRVSNELQKCARQRYTAEERCFSIPGTASGGQRTSSTKTVRYQLFGIAD